MFDVRPSDVVVAALGTTDGPRAAHRTPSAR